jgi:hypothetical protein
MKFQQAGVGWIWDLISDPEIPDPLSSIVHQQLSSAPTTLMTATRESNIIESKQLLASKEKRQPRN